MVKCELCGYEFDEVGLMCHSQCPMGNGCNIICCPNCGYQVVDVSKSQSAALIQRVGAILTRWRGGREEQNR